MRNQLRYSFLLLVFFLSINIVYAVNTPKKPSPNKNGMELVYENVSIDDFLEKDRQQIEEQIGQKLTFKERLLFRSIQKSIQKAIRKGQSKDDVQKALAIGDFKLDNNAYFLGGLIPIFGIIAVYIFFKKDKKRARKSAWIGFGACLLAVLLTIWLASVIVNRLGH